MADVLFKNSISQVVAYDSEYAPCLGCGNDLSELGSFEYAKIELNEDRYRKEFCTCKNCGKVFIIRYDFFDSGGHIQEFVFSEDINNPESNWQDIFTHGQRHAFKEHMKECTMCCSKLDETLLLDSWILDILNTGKQHDKITKNKKGKELVCNFCK